MAGKTTKTRGQRTGDRGQKPTSVDKKSVVKNAPKNAPKKAGNVRAVARKNHKKTVRKVGRPDGFSWPVAERILDSIAGGESLTNACEKDGLPTRKTVSGWVRKGALGVDVDLRSFAEGFVLACRVRVALLEDDFVELIRKIRTASKEEFTEMVAVRFKLEMDGLKWYLGKFRVGAQLDGVDEALARLKADCGDGEEDGRITGFRLVVHRGESDEA
jgi:hypothetical protein